VSELPEWVTLPKEAIEAAGQPVADKLWKYSEGIASADDVARVAIEAAAPHIRRAALEEAAQELDDCDVDGGAWVVHHLMEKPR
jgi:hypothetical protein